MYANEEECRSVGLDPEKVNRIAARINQAAKEARALGLEVFGGSNGSLRVISSGPPLVVAEMSGGAWNGGDGAITEGPDGLLYGEH